MGSTPITWKKSPLTRMPLAYRTSPPVAKLNRWSLQTAISENPSCRLRICSHIANVSWEYWLENWPEPQWRPAIHALAPLSRFLHGFVHPQLDADTGTSGD